MSTLFEKRNPDATIKSVAYSMATTAIGILLGMMMADQVWQRGFVFVLSWTASGSALAGVIEWHFIRWPCLKKLAAKVSTTMKVFCIAMIVAGLVVILGGQFFDTH